MTRRAAQLPNALLQGARSEIRADDLDQARAEIEAAGGSVTVEPFEFPGGRRFHFREPGGSELAARGDHRLTDEATFLSLPAGVCGHTPAGASAGPPCAGSGDAGNGVLALPLASA